MIAKEIRLLEKFLSLAILASIFFTLSLHGENLPPRSPGYTEPFRAASLEPQFIENPGPEYSDEFRMYQGIPGIERAPNGRLWAVWYGGGIGENRYNYIMLVTSDDDGETWSDVRFVIDSDSEGPVPDFDPETWPTNDQIGKPTRITGSRRVFDPVPWHDPEGRLWLFFAQERRRATDAPHRPAVTWAVVTEDSGSAYPKWSKPRIVFEGIMMNKPTVLSNGEWHFPVAYWAGEPSAGVVVSRDSGKTFGFLGGASLFPERMRNVDEHMIVERNDGTLWMLVRSYMNSIGQSFSDDGGRTWTPIEQNKQVKGVPISENRYLGHPNARFFVRRLSTGNVLLVKHGELDEVTRPRAKLMAYLSDDEGKTWKGGLMIDERPGVSYPDGVEGDDGVIYIIYDYDRTGNDQDSKSIHMARFTEKDVLAGSPVSDTFATRLLINKAKAINLLMYNINNNEDGDDMSEPTTMWGLADLEAQNGEIATLKNGVHLFAGSDETALQIPQELLGRPFIRAPRSGTRFKAIESGLVYVMTPAPERMLRVSPPTRLTQSHSQRGHLLNLGFRKANFPEALLAPGPEYVVSTYYRNVEAGEEIELKEWAVVVF